MRVLICGLAVLLLLGAAWAQPDPDDDFNITVTVNMLGITLYDDGGQTGGVPYPDWGLGDMPAGATAEMYFDDPNIGGDDHVEAFNSGNCVADLWVFSDEAAAPGPCGFGTPACWHPAAAPAADIYYLECGVGAEDAFPGAYTPCPDPVAPGVMAAPALPDGATAHRFFRFTTPNPVSDGCPHDITVQVAAFAP